MTALTLAQERGRVRDGVLTEEELRFVWTTIESMPAPMAAFYKLRLLTAQRDGEVSALRWRDVDIEQGWWTIPAAGSKNKLAHRVPLTASAVSIIAALLATAKADEDFVLAGARGKRQQAEAAALFTVDDFRGHVLRRTAVYDRHSYDPEKRVSLEWWAGRLLALVNDGERGRMLPFIGSR